LGRNDDAKEVRHKINEIKVKREKEIKKSKSRIIYHFSSILPKFRDPGYIPARIFVYCVPILIIGYLLSLISKSFYFLGLIGIIGFLLAYFIYSINIYESGGNYRFLSVLMLLIPMIPFDLMGTIEGITFAERFLLFMGKLGGGFLITWLFLFIIVKIKQIFITTRKNPPNVLFTVFSIAVVFIVYFTFSSIHPFE
jgi:hypothetical protein